MTLARSCKALIIEDETNLRRVMRAHLEDAGWLVAEASDGAAGLRAAADQIFDVVFTDLVMPNIDGLGVIAGLRAEGFSGPIVMITAHATVEAAVEAMKSGAYDFLVKPVPAADLVAVAEKAARHAAAVGADFTLPESGGATMEAGLVSASPAMKRILESLPAIAASDSSVLITGETGTGKSVIAKAIHEASRRRSGPFVVVNSAAIPATLAESEFFGHERGAFTGAVARRPGRFELADRGTIFLDEIGELEMNLQAKLLRVIEEKKCERVGGSSTIAVDVRIIAATHRDLDLARREGRFREDLYYRLNVIPIRIPPLRERREEIGPLAAACVARIAKQLGKPPVTIDPQALAMLEACSWPGNVRELENVLERALVFLSGSVLASADLPDELKTSAVTAPSASPPATESLRDSRRSAESDRLRVALAASEGNVTRAAASLGISRRGLQIKMKEYGLR